MIFLPLLIPILLFTQAFLDVGPYLERWSVPFHAWCISHSPATTWQPLYSSLVCGEELKNPIVELFRSTGLIHLMVVSGSHLVVISMLLRRLGPSKLTSRLALPVLFGYVLVCQANPPVTRAWVGQCVSALTQRLRLGWSQNQVVLVSGLLTLLFVPSWGRSWSLVLSWLSALALTIPPPAHRRWAQLKLCGWIYLILWFPMAAFSPTHPLSILSNWLLAPLIGGIMLPACLLAFAIPGAAFIVDWMWIALEQTLSWLDPLAASTKEPLPLSILSAWIYLVLWQLGLHWWSRRQKRRSLCLDSSA